MRKVLTVLLLMVSLAAMTATVAYADGKPIIPDQRMMSFGPIGRSLR